ncbi:39S ribosomal protein L19, mitochondrial [Anopheles cruzii]|uniref:39S ribosomal protein L19, mitochondrial n=1 Tax=Anopheles cruzii TaxID=68878 RepID=UPI0022EC30C6|nr:39S ribosomal protein L19, mitochondrial [Anopheles cruzii]
MNCIKSFGGPRGVWLLRTFRRIDHPVRTAAARCYSTKPAPATTNSKQPSTASGGAAAPGERKSIIPPNYRHVYREFLPDPKLEWRNSLREKLERRDMLSRRANIDIPEFYVGSVLAVTASDRHAETKTARFVGICILREKCGLRARFILRNVIDHQGIEISYDLYDPTLQKIEVLRLEKRVDDQLIYLRDALDEYSTFDVNMEPETLPDGAPVPVNDLKVVLKPHPWYARWERHNLQGVANMAEHTNERRRVNAARLATPWEKYDLMKEYRRSIPEEEQKEIFTEVYSTLHSQELAQKKMKRKRIFVKPTKLA